MKGRPVAEKKEKIIVLTSTFPRWENDPDPPFVYELSRRLVSRFEVHVLAPAYPGALDEEEMDGLNVHRFRYFSRPFEKLAGSTGILPTLRRNPFCFLLVPFFLLGELLALYRLTRKLAPAAIHAHWLVPQGWAAAIVGRACGVPFLVTVHGGDIFGLRQAAVVAAKKRVLRTAAAVTAVSRAIADEITRLVPGAGLLVVPMGVDSSRFSGAAAGAVRQRFGVNGKFVLFAGRLSEKKGVRYLLDAMPAVINRFPDAKLVIAGSGEEEERLRAQCHSLGLGGNVIFAGAVPNSELAGFYADADVFVGPSVTARGGDTEGFGLTFVEAGMSGCILIGSDVGGIRDIIRPGETGFLVPEKDPAALAETLITVFEQEESWPEMRMRTRQEFVARFDWRVIAEKYAAIIAEAAAGAPRRAG